MNRFLQDGLTLEVRP